MSYCTGKNIEKSRGKAMKMLVIEKKPVYIVANRFGVNRSTIWRWHQKWVALNSDKELENHYRPSREPGKQFRWNNVHWDIPTLSAAPKCPKSLSNELIQLVLDVRDQIKRCAEIVWFYINEIYCIKISLSSVRRILNKYRPSEKKQKKRKSFKGIKRPNILAPGDLVETDTIHLYNPITGNKRYIYTVIDLYTRMAYARVYTKLAPGNAITTISEAEQYFGFEFKIVQSDNGPEFSSYFENKLLEMRIQPRHTRLHRPNDNAHIERFNRTIQEECTGSYFLEKIPLKELDDKILSYIDFYNHRRIHLGLKCMTPNQMLHRL